MKADGRPDLVAEIWRLNDLLGSRERELIELRRLLTFLCPQCGKLSWEVPLEDYCICDLGREKPDGS